MPLDGSFDQTPTDKKTLADQEILRKHHVQKSDQRIAKLGLAFMKELPIATHEELLAADPDIPPFTKKGEAKP